VKCPTALHFPAFAILAADVLVDLGHVRALHFLDVPIEFLSDAGELREVADERECGEHRGYVVETRTGLAAVLDAVKQVFDRAAFCAGQCRLRRREFLHARLRQKLESSGGARRVKEPLVPDVQRALAYSVLSPNFAPCSFSAFFMISGLSLPSS
jgi:hypothetical protein